MTQWTEMPIRPQGRPWRGIDTRSGKLDDGTGQMTDASTNVIINAADRLEKRKGLIRGLDERFAGAVCGLHAYTDECGREWLIVADDGGFSIRQPFAIPSFASSDAYPSDDFQGTGPVDPNFWTGSGYTRLGGSLALAGETAADDLRWFKLASNFSYQAEIAWTVPSVSSETDSRAIVAIKIGAVARLELRVINAGGSLSAALVWTQASGDSRVLAAAGLPGIESGVATLSYQRNTVKGIFEVQAVVQPAGGSAVQLQDAVSINAVADADLGQGTALRLEGDATIQMVQGGPL